MDQLDSDRFKWLEEDSDRVRTWLADQRRLTTDALAALPGSLDAIRDAGMRDRGHGWSSVPLGRGGRWFFHSRPQGADRVAVHLGRTMLDPGRPILSPDRFDDPRGLASIGAIYPSPDGRHLIASVFRGGRQATELVLLSVPEDGPATVLGRLDTPTAAFAVWHDETSYFCSREADGRALLSLHQLDGGETHLPFPCDTTGARLVPITSDDGAWLLVTLHAPHLSSPRLFVAANAPTPAFHEVFGPDVRRLRMAWWGPRGPLLVVRAGDGPREVIEADLTALPAGGTPVLRLLHRDDTGTLVTALASPSGDALLFLRGPGGADRFRHLGADGSIEEVAFEEGASVLQTTIERSTGAMLASVHSWTKSQRLVEYDFRTRRFTTLRQANMVLDVDVTTTAAMAEDGTPIPVTLLRPAHLSQARDLPCLMVAYGAFGASLSPWCLTIFKPWFDAGGMVAHAHVRGGGEGRQGWHEAAKGAAKVTSFTDLIAVCRGLAASGHARTERLCLWGTGAGGMLVLGAVMMAQDICAGVVADNPIADMANFPRWGNGAYWVGEFGDPATDWAAIAHWSPLHNVRPGADYPPILVVAGADDDHVGPIHGRKMVAALQAAGATALLREDQGCGHAGAVTLGAQSEEWAQVQRFAAWAADLALTPPVRGV